MTDTTYEVRPALYLNDRGEPMSYRVVELAGDFEHRTKRNVKVFPNITYGVPAETVRRRAARYASRLRSGKEKVD